VKLSLHPLAVAVSDIVTGGLSSNNDRITRRHTLSRTRTHSHC